MDTMTVLESFAALLRGSVLTFFLGACGLYCTVKTRWFFFRHPTRLFRESLSRSSFAAGVSPFRALCVALGGTIGVGNTVGVAVALSEGGPGALFWMWVSAALGMSLKYAEVFLALRFRDSKNGFGGAMILLRDQLKKPFLSILFCIFCVMASFGMGNAAQSGAAAENLNAALGIPKILSGAIIALLCLCIFAGGLPRLARVSGICVPLTSLMFFLLSIAVIYCNRHNLPSALGDVFRGAFSIRSGIYGVSAYGFLYALRAGFSRGIFSNEAGLGSTPLVHSSADSTPQSQGIRGAFEVFFDTIFVCTLSALAILTSPVFRSKSADPASLCTVVFRESLGKYGAILFALSLSFFAIESILAWGHFGKIAVTFLFPHQPSAIYIYFFAFFATALFSASFDFAPLLFCSDIANALMALPNLYAIFALRGDLRAPT